MKINVVKTALISFAVVVGLFIITFLVLFFAAPKFLANVFDNMGSDNIALYFYKKDYQKNKNADSLYKVVNLSISKNDYSGVVTYFEKFEQDDSFEVIIKNANEYYLALNESLIIKASMYNEANYLRNKYVEALLQTGKSEQAATYAMGHFDYNFIQPNNQGDYLFKPFFTNEFFNDINFNTEFNGVTLIEVVTQYFINLTNSVQGLTVDLHSVEATALAMRAQLVGENLIFYNSKTQNQLPLSSEQIAVMLTEINVCIANFINGGNA